MVHLGFFQHIPLIFAEYIVFCVGGDAHIAPRGSYEFAEDFRKNGFICRVDVGIDSYARTYTYAKKSGVRPFERHPGFFV